MYGSERRNRVAGSYSQWLMWLFLFLGVLGAVGLSGCSDTPEVSNPVKVVPSPTAVAQSQSNGTPVPVPALNPQQAAAATQTADVESAGNRPNSTGYFFAEATSHSVEAFEFTFAKLGGVESLGYPITQEYIEQSTSDGHFYWVQLFEKAELEYHASDPVYPYQITPLGVWRFSQKYAVGTPQVKSVPGEGSNTFNETGHTVQGLFLDYWNKYGGLRRFGFPVSESFEEKSDADGTTYIVQYFERAVMEYHPEQKAPNNVQLAALGSMKVAQVYAGGVPGGAGNPVPSPTVDATKTAVAIVNATATAETTNANATATAETSRANETATAVAKQERANATATARAFASFKTTAPDGEYSQSGQIAIWCGHLDYRRTVGYQTANTNSKFLVMSVTVTNHRSNTLFVNPNDFTIVGVDGFSVGYDASTFSFDRPFPSVELEQKAYAAGAMSFLVPSGFIPSKLVWRGFTDTVTVTIVPVP